MLPWMLAAIPDIIALSGQSEPLYPEPLHPQTPSPSAHPAPPPSNSKTLADTTETAEYIGALIITYTILGVPGYKYSIVGPKSLFQLLRPLFLEPL